MKGWTGNIAALAIFLATGAEAAPANLDFGQAPDVTIQQLPYLQCVPYAREVTGINLFGDAHTWWGQAAGRYARGNQPRVGAVMSFRPYGSMVLGHVAAVSKVLDSRTVLLRHANWSPINGRRGQVEDNVRAVDVSDANDWSEVRVWFAPIQGLGTTRWPVNGFIYPQKAQIGEGVQLASAQVSPRTAALASGMPARSRIGSDFLKGIVPETARGGPAMTPATRNLSYSATPAASRSYPAQPYPVRSYTAQSWDAPRPVTKTARARNDDPIGQIIARVTD
ncbi:CHAP domain-containing protein [Novosphingobium lentum]|uniref:CHAP domain-containing protein n=1 Tax=Novosphingobium lentum TaxID=145287 RepID=UPI0009FF633B|nr:CHAP domain-containing protein [Novosphingobium lentum]